MIKLRIPATTANMGSGFDAIGLALTKYNEFYFEKMSSGFEIIGTLPEHKGEKNLVYSSYIYTLNKLKNSEKKYSGGIKIRFSSDIPICRGLGSSATCIIAGVAAALIFQTDSIEKIDKEKILNIATEIEGHPDNIAPALYGGAIVSTVVDKKVVVERLDMKKNFDFVALIPDFTLSTEKSRSVLPEKVDFKDATFNVARVSLLISALTSGNVSTLKYACQDRLHQPYRSKLIESYDDVMEIISELNAYAAFISGAGPSILAIVENGIEFSLKCNKKLPKKWTSEALKLDIDGLIIDKLK